MHDEKVSFYSEGVKLAGVLHRPDRDDGKPRPAIVQGPGFLGVKEAAIYLRWYEKFCEAGYAALAFDYRGWGDSEGEERGAVIPMDQVQDIRNAITYLQTRDDVDPNRIGGFGSGASVHNHRNRYYLRSPTLYNLHSLPDAATPRNDILTDNEPFSGLYGKSSSQNETIGLLLSKHRRDTK